MARSATRLTATLALLATLPMLAGCASIEPASANAADWLPSFGWAPPRMRPPSVDRPVWLAPQPTAPQRLPAPEFGFRG